MGIDWAGEDFDNERERMEVAREEIRTHAETQQAKKNAKNKASYDKRKGAGKTMPKEGDTVWKKDAQIPKKLAENKFLPRWHGPYRVVKVTSSTAHIQRQGGPAIRVVRFELLEKHGAPFDESGSVTSKVRGLLVIVFSRPTASKSFPQPTTSIWLVGAALLFFFLVVT